MLLFINKISVYIMSKEVQLLVEFEFKTARIQQHITLYHSNKFLPDQQFSKLSDINFQICMKVARPKVIYSDQYLW